MGNLYLKVKELLGICGVRGYFDCCITYFKDHIDPSPLDTLTGLQQQIRSDESMGSQVDETSGVLVGMASGQMEVKVKVKQTETVPGPKVRNFTSQH